MTMTSMNETRQRIFVGLVLLAVLAALPTGALAQDESADAAGDDGDEEDRQAKARMYYKQGKEAYDRKDFEEALLAFQAAYDTKPHPIVLKSIAECKVMLGNIPGAIEALEAYLNDPLATEHDKVQARLDEIKEMVAKLEVTTDPEGALITVDTEPTEQRTPSTLELSPGDHVIRLEVEGYEPLVKTVTLEKGAESALEVDFAVEGIPLEPSGELVDPFADEQQPEEQAEQDSAGPPPAFWVCAALTGVGLVGGTVFGAMALNDEDDYAKSPTQAKKDAGERSAIIADVSFGVAAASAIVGTVILLTYDKEDSSAPDEAKLEVHPIAGDGTVGLGAVLDF